MTKRLMVGDVAVGGGAPVSIQSMCNTKTDDVRATVEQIHALEAAGCEIIRIAIPDQAAAEAVDRIKEQISIPLIADIHFNYKYALACAERGIDAIRINPGRPFHSYRHLCWRHQRRPNLCVPAENSRDLSISCHHLGRLSHGQAWQAGGCTVSWCVCLLDWWHIFCYCPGDHSAAAIQGHIKVRALGVFCTDFFQYLRSALHGQF